MGWVVDNTRSRYGKFRPWIIIGTALNAAVTVGLFIVPNNLPAEAYIAILYVLWGMTYTLMDIPFWSMVPALSKTKAERERVAVVPRMFASGAWLLIGVAGLPLVNALGGGDEAYGYFTLAVLIAFVFAISSLITFFNVKEIYLAGPNAEKVTLAGAAKLIASNDQLRVLAVILIGFNLVLQITGGAALYYFTYVVGSEAMFSVYAGGMGWPRSLDCSFFQRSPVGWAECAPLVWPRYCRSWASPGCSLPANSQVPTSSSLR
jgi:melibiose permease